MIDVTCFSWVKMIQKSGMPPQANHLAHYLATYMNLNHDVAWPSLTRIQNETGLARSTIAKYLAWLEAAGWVARERGHSTKSTRYKICIPADAILETALGGSTRDGLQGSAPSGLGSTPDGLGSATDGLGVVRDADPNNNLITKNNKGEGKRFKPPTLDDCKTYFAEKNSTPDEATKFFNHYDASNWYRGKTKLQRWKAAASQWIGRTGEFSNQKTKHRGASIMDDLTDTSWAH